MQPQPKVPTHWITDPKFRYVPASQTDIRKTFERIRKQLQKAKGTA